MRSLTNIILLLFVHVVTISAQKPETITFSSEDGLTITADTYIAHEDKTIPFIVLFHQAGWSRGEYVEIAPKLNMLGFNCMAIDQRSGGEVNKIKNETKKEADKKKLSTNYPDALPDLIAAVKYARKNLADGKLIIWGSSYSAALSLKIAGDFPELVDGVLAFAPGEYFERFGKPADWIQQSANKIEDPVFITSAKDEEPKWRGIFDAIESKDKIAFIPKTEGNHGSRALWSKFADSENYWKAVIPFLIIYLIGNE